MGFRNPIGADDILTPGSVGSTQLADGSVVTPKLADIAVTQPKTYPPVSVAFPYLANSVIDYAGTDATWQALRVLKDVNNVVWAEGAIYNNGPSYVSGVVPIQFPTGFRPYYRHRFSGWVSSGPAVWDIYADGGCHLFIPSSTSTGWLTGQTATLDGIRFLVG